MSQKKISDYVVEDAVTGYFAVRKKEVREYTRGQYVHLELGDSSGRIDGKMWEPDQFALSELNAGTVVKAKGVVTEYNGKKQLTVDRIRLAEQSEYVLEDILPHSTQTIEQRRTRILTLTEKIQNAYIKQLVESFWGDDKFFGEFLNAAAGKLWHHAYIGGLAEHSANVAELALRVSAGYDFLDKDLLIFGGLFHDAGKVEQYKIDTMIDYSDAGRLIGHICIADAWITERAHKIEAFPDSLLSKLRHLILSHQGQLEYASPVLPQMPEAFVLFYCDEIDSKMGAIERIRERQGGEGWSEYVKLLDRHLFFGNEEKKSE
ncbi:MAG: 3'-5' exoribonuclease YhaM family protein [Candidatus Zixiibacteriota bacterium]